VSADATGWVYRFSPATGATLLVHLAIADSANDQHGYELWMRQAWLAGKARVSRRAVNTALAWLADNALLELLEQGAKAGRPNRYRLLMPKLTAVFDPQQGVQPVHTPSAAGAQGGENTVHTGVRTGVTHNPRDNPKENPTKEGTAPTVSQRARAIISSLHDERRAANQPGVPNFIASVKVVERMLQAGWTDEAVGRACRKVPTITTGWLEGELRKGRPRATNAAVPARQEGPARAEVVDL
jgi:hypothetical protein